MNGTETSSSRYQSEHARLINRYHSKCLFNVNPPVNKLNFTFRDDGSSYAKVFFSEIHQGYDGKVHGGLVAAVIDAAMVQCLMGHGVLAYTAELKTRYKYPVDILTETEFNTVVLSESKGKLFLLETRVLQLGVLKVAAKSKFIRAEDLD